MSLVVKYFDYSWDPTGVMIEHYTDGDTVNKDTLIGFGPACHESLPVWGPDVPHKFLDLEFQCTA
ncbi:hypothetical protein OIDMADRAFT_48854 [Oidiodendron maius Zn]|uniref:Uncharacterized protein n=1 Tax=Oidiodendron maius (strain Zn) TaxID=913774 RepID=A0A0C3E3R9_OIDMZ|nr:hypothetical protein OIDMADRAFT_48854 [Oidiodendron maius Zn]